MAERSMPSSRLAALIYMSPGHRGAVTARGPTQATRRRRRDGSRAKPELRNAPDPALESGSKRKDPRRATCRAQRRGTVGAAPRKAAHPEPFRSSRPCGGAERVVGE